ncbi:MAG TPA: DUF4157 domain-containing protein [Kofleriaceae bacterium]|nr:DUF4157 domain-containing protein [Kofleriaceae bacterium]
MSDHKQGEQTPAPRAAEPGAGAATSAGPGKRTLVEQAQGDEAHGPDAPKPRGARPGAASQLAKPRAASGPGPVSGPGPRTGLGAFAGAIARARGPRELSRAMPPGLMARHDLLPRGAAPGAAVQRKASAAGGSADVLEAAAHGTSGAGGALPHLGEIQRSFGRHDVSGVQAHTDEAATSASRAMGAEAYATGSHVAFAGAPTLHTAAHEAAHVVQQRGGVQLRGGVGQAGDRYEQHADRVADAVVRGDSSEAMLDELGGRGGGAAPSGGAVQHRLDAVQFDVRGTVDQQRNARDVDTPQGGSAGQHGAFQDQAPDDHGPAIHHDHGFLDDGSGNIDDSLRRDPTWGDRLERAKWIAKLEAAELLRPDLVDGTAAYRHFLFGNGAERDVQYGRFLANDSSGHTVLASAMEDTRQAALERHDQDLAGAAPAEGSRTYQIRTSPISVTSGDARYPYPATENWQKALGAHTIWIEAAVTVTVTQLRDAGSEPLPGGVPAPGEGSSSDAGPPTFSRHFHVEMTIHAEDMYNFNPGNVDIATGTPDAANGRFEVTGLGHEYMNRGTFSQPFDFDATMEPAASPGSSATPNDPGRASRSGRPADRRAYPTTR